MIPIELLLGLSTLLFFIGFFGFVTRRNLIAMLISIELVLNSVDINFAVFNRILYPGELEGFFFSLFSIGINAYGDNRTILCIAIDGENSIHHALQLAADTYMDRDGTTCTFTHNGSITVGQLGARKRSELRPYVQRLYPRIVRKDDYLLGILHHDRPWYIDDPEIKTFLMNLISYALIRDRFRADVQAQDTYLRKK